MFWPESWTCMNRAKDMDRIFLQTVIVMIAASLAVELVRLVDYSMLGSLLVSQIILALPAVFYICRYRIKLKDLLRIRKVRIVNVVLLVLFAYFITPLMNIINEVSMLFATNVIDNTVSHIIPEHSLFVSLFAIAFVPCVMEDAVYRGVFFNEYRKVDPLKGIFLSALLFGLMHMNINQFVYAFPMGIIFAMLVEGTDSLLSSMIVHFVINGMSVLSVYMMPAIRENAAALYGAEKAAQMYPEQAGYTTVQLLDMIRSGIIPAIINTVIAAVLFVIIVKNAGRWEHMKEIFRRKDSKEKQQKAKEPTRLCTPSLLAGMGICVFIMIWTEIAQYI